MSSPTAAEAERQAPAAAPKREEEQKTDKTGGVAFQEYGTPRERSTASRKESAAAEEAPLPYDDEAPPLPDEAPPGDDGWDFRWDTNANAYYFFNKWTGVSQWENPRQPGATASTYGSYASSYPSSSAIAHTSSSAIAHTSSSAIAHTSSSGAPGTSSPPKRKYGGYNPAIHGNYDPKADYAKEAEREEEEAEAAKAALAAAALPKPIVGDYSTVAHFNRYNGRYQQAGNNAEYHNDENKSKRQMNAFFDVDAAANSHDGRSLKAERRGKTLTKQEVQAFRAKRREKKEEKRRAWLRD